jgi:hypothetical protein
MPWRGLSTSSPAAQGIAVTGICNGDRFTRGFPSFSSVIDGFRLAARLDCMLLGLLLPGLEFDVCAKMDGGGETSPSGVLGEDTTIGNRASTTGRDMWDLSIDRRGVFFIPMRLVNSVKENPRLLRLPSGASAGGSASGEDALERRSSSSPARSPIEVLDRLRRIDAIGWCGRIACRYRIVGGSAGGGIYSKQRVNLQVAR